MIPESNGTLLATLLGVSVQLLISCSYPLMGQHIHADTGLELVNIHILHEQGEIVSTGYGISLHHL